MSVARNIARSAARCGSRITRLTVFLCLLAGLTTGFIFSSIGLVSKIAQAAPSTPPPALSFKPWELVNALAWSPDGKLLAVAAGNQIHLVQVDTLQTLHRLQLPALTQSMSFSPDGAQLAAASRDGFLRVWKLTQMSNAPVDGGAPAWQVAAHKKGANALAYSPDGTVLASGGNDGMARLWQSDTGKPLSAIIGGAYAVSALAFSPDGATLAIINSNVVRLRDPSSGRISGTLRGDDTLYSLAYHPQGNLLAVGDSANHILLWDPAQAFRSGNLTYPEPVVLIGHSGRSGLARALVWRVAFSPDGALLASAGGDGTVRIWDVKQRQLVQTLVGHTNAVTSLAFSPDGRRLASGSLDGTVHFWDIRN